MALPGACTQVPCNQRVMRHIRHRKPCPRDPLLHTAQVSNSKAVVCLLQGQFSCQARSQQAICSPQVIHVFDGPNALCSNHPVHPWPTQCAADTGASQLLPRLLDNTLLLLLLLQPLPLLLLLLLLKVLRVLLLLHRATPNAPQQQSL